MPVKGQNKWFFFGGGGGSRQVMNTLKVWLISNVRSTDKIAFVLAQELRSPWKENKSPFDTRLRRKHSKHNKDNLLVKEMGCYERQVNK